MPAACPHANLHAQPGLLRPRSLPHRPAQRQLQLRLLDGRRRKRIVEYEHGWRVQLVVLDGPNSLQLHIWPEEAPQRCSASPTSPVQPAVQPLLVGRQTLQGLLGLPAGGAWGVTPAAAACVPALGPALGPVLAAGDDGADGSSLGSGRRVKQCLLLPYDASAGGGASVPAAAGVVVGRLPILPASRYVAGSIVGVAGLVEWAEVTPAIESSQLPMPFLQLSPASLPPAAGTSTGTVALAGAAVGADGFLRQQ